MPENLDIHDVRAFKDHKLDKIGKINGLPENKDYGRTFMVLDPAGVLIHLTQFHD